MLHSTKISVKPYKLCAEPQERKTRPAESPDTSQNQIIRQICLRELCKRDIGALVPTTSLTIHPSARPSIHPSIQPAYRSSALSPYSKRTHHSDSLSQTIPNPYRSFPQSYRPNTHLPPSHPSILKKKKPLPKQPRPDPKTRSPPSAPRNSSSELCRLSPRGGRASHVCPEICSPPVYAFLFARIKDFASRGFSSTFSGQSGLCCCIRGL